MTRPLPLLLCLPVLLGASPAAAPGPPAPRPLPALLKGVALGHYTDITAPVLERKLREIRALGANHVSVVVAWGSANVRSSSVEPRPGHTTPDPVLPRIIARAHAHGLGVLLFPIIAVEHRKPLEWRGTIRPPSWDAWWRSYRRFIVHYARLAAAARVELLSVGSELVSTEGQTRRWTDLIREVRGLYRGSLIYSANWDHYRPVTFWSQVDLVGLTSYYRIARERDAPQSEMQRAWRQVRDQLVGWARATKRRFVFTEVGYPSLDGGAVHPWDYTQGTAVDLEEQRRAFSAFVSVWTGVPELAGVYFWDWYGDGGPADRRYTPRGKPAAGVIRGYFHARSPSAARAPAGPAEQLD